MAASYLILMALWGLDPDRVFADSLPRDEQALAFVSPLGAISTRHPVVSMVEAPARSAAPHLNRLVTRGQIVEDPNPTSLSTLSGSGFWEHPLVHEFVSGMNPFAAEEVRTLEGYYDPFGCQASFGTNGHQPFRLGWVSYNDITLIPASPVYGTTGTMKIVEWNANLRVSHVIAPGVLFNGTGWASARWWDGPTGVPLPGQVDQISTDLELGLFNDGPWSGQIAFHPQIVESFEAPLNRYAFNFDGRAIAMYRASANWSFVGGVAFWDRVDQLVVPHVGVIWTPNERWEFRLLFPRSRASYYLGQWRGADFWLYGEAEYHVEAFQDTIRAPTIHDRVQIADERVNLGLRWDKSRYSFFVDGGYVFDRHAKFAGSLPGFDIGNMGMIRAGFRY